MKKLFIPLIIIVSVMVGALGWSLINTPTTISLKPQAKIVIASPQNNTASPQATPKAVYNIPGESPLVFANPSVTIDAFETAIPQKNWFDLPAFMTETVNVIKYGTSCCGNITKKQAESELFYLNGSTNNWNFDERNPIALEIAKKDPEHFTETFIGTSSNYYAIGLKLNDDYLIEKIILVSDYRMITGL